MAESWDKWRCPYPACGDADREYEDPSTMERTTCERGHVVRLVWRDGSVSARMVGRVNRHKWRVHFGGYWFCWRCQDTAALMARLPVFGCVGFPQEEKPVEK
jgi:hypothetical protein